MPVKNDAQALLQTDGGILRSFLFQNVSYFSTLHYRVSTIPKELWQEFLKMAGNKSTDQEEIKTLLVDGTGWGYGLPFYLKSKKGRRDKSEPPRLSRKARLFESSHSGWCLLEIVILFLKA